MQSEKKDWQEDQQKLQLDRDRYTSSNHTHYHVASMHRRLTLLNEKLGLRMRQLFAKQAFRASIRSGKAADPAKSWSTKRTQ